MTRIVVTGATGFIGRAVIPHLLASGHELHLITRDGAMVPGCHVHRGDLLGDVDSLLTDIDAEAMLHLAWYAKPGLFWHAPENLDWVAASLRLARGFAAAGGRRVVVAGTCAEYDWGFQRLHETLTPRRPHTLYGKAKAALFDLLSAAAPGLGLSLGWGRIFFPYGPDEAPGRLFSGIVDGIAAGRQVDCSAGLQSRDFMHVDDVARAFALLLSSEVEGAVNIAYGDVVRVRDFITRVAEAAGDARLVRLGARPLQPGEPIYMAAATARLRDEVGFTPRLDLADGITGAVASRLGRSVARPTRHD